MNQAKLSRAVRMKRMKMRRATTKKKTTPRAPTPRAPPSSPRTSPKRVTFRGRTLPPPGTRLMGLKPWMRKVSLRRRQ